MADSVAARLARAEGHLRHVRGLVEGGAYCDEALQQILAVQAAITAAAELLVERELESCLLDLGQDADEDRRERLRRLHRAVRHAGRLPRSRRQSAEVEAEDED